MNHFETIINIVLSIHARKPESAAMILVILKPEDLNIIFEHIISKQILFIKDVFAMSAISCCENKVVIECALSSINRIECEPSNDFKRSIIDDSKFTCNPSPI